MVKYQPIDSIYSSLSDSTRRTILERIKNENLDLAEIAKEYNISLPAVSKHLKVLEKADLITRQKKGREYTFTLKEAAKFWINQFQLLEQFLENKKEVE